MTDVSPAQAHADTQPDSVVPFGNPQQPPYANCSPTLDGTLEDEESSTIKCICGFPGDDGNTVLCERCNTWQHIICYYETTDKVPDVHECVDCSPRIVDTKRAIEKQMPRHVTTLADRRGKAKAATKNNKKRAKDPLGTVQPNGWAVHPNDSYYSADRKSGSPRDHPPPSKRSKTSHRPSASLSLVGPIIDEASFTTGTSRKRSGSTMHGGHTPPKSPLEDPNERFSPQFMNLYLLKPAFDKKGNSYADIRITNDFAEWCNDRGALAEATGGLQPGQVYHHVDRTISSLDELAPPLRLHFEEDTSITAHGQHPQWCHLVVHENYGKFVPSGTYIGEVTGRIGRRKDYVADPTNRWESLRHPEPFVFFPPHLPIYIDTRQGGSMLRYIRRSCDPNVQMKIMKSDETGPHFFLIAMRDIEPGEELTIGWEIGAEIRQEINDSLHNGDIHKGGLKKIQPWVSCILANFGGCACDKSRGRVCLLEHVRRPSHSHSEPAQPARSGKGRKMKKSQIPSIGAGNASNNRAGSEGHNRNGADDEHNTDARSTSDSRKSTSRDITPATFLSGDGGEPKMSDREKRKLQQQERLFEQLEYDQQHKSKRAKRNSAGSNMNTPSLSSSKQLGQSEHSRSSRTPEHSHGAPRKPSGTSRTNGRIVSRPKPVYCDASTQIDDTLPQIRSRIPKSVIDERQRRRKPSRIHRLLQEARDDLRVREERERTRSASVKAEARSPTLQDVASTNLSPVLPPAAAQDEVAMNVSTGTDPMDISTTIEAPVGKHSASVPPPGVDIEMKDIDASTHMQASSPMVETHQLCRRRRERRKR